MAAHLARFQTDDPLLGECDPWAGMEFHTPLGPGRAAYRPDGPLPKDFPRVIALIFVTAIYRQLFFALMGGCTAKAVGGVQRLCGQLQICTPLTFIRNLEHTKKKKLPQNHTARGIL